MMQNIVADLATLFRQIAEDPIGAANRLDEMANRLRIIADNLRNSTRSVGGATDRVQMTVIGPDGKIKQHTDTN